MFVIAIAIIGVKPEYEYDINNTNILYFETWNYHDLMNVWDLDHFSFT